MGCHGKSQAHVHAAGVALDRGIDEFLHLGKIHDLIKLAGHFLFGHAQDGAVEVDILAPGQLGVKAGAHLQQAGDAPFDLDLPAGGGGDAREDLEQGALAGAVAPDDAQHLALLDGEVDIFERPQGFAVAVAVVGLADLEQRVGFAARFGPPDFQVVGEGAGADLAQAVGFGEIFDRDNGVVIILDRIHKGLLDAVEHHRSQDHHYQHKAKTVEQVQGMHRPGAQEGIAESLHDGGHRVELDDPLEAFRDGGGRIDDRGGVHQQLNAKLTRKRRSRYLVVSEEMMMPKPRPRPAMISISSGESRIHQLGAMAEPPRAKKAIRPGRRRTGCQR